MSFHSLVGGLARGWTQTKRFPKFTLRKAHLAMTLVAQILLARIDRYIGQMQYFRYSQSAAVTLFRV